MKKTAYLLAIVLTVFMATQSYASIQLNTLPSTKFVRSTGEPKAETKTFSGIGGPARIKLVNGDLADTTIEKVSSSEIKVNGLLVFGPSDFNQKVTNLEKNINLNEGSNTLSALLKGKPGGTVSIQIIQILDNIKLQPSKILLQEKGATSQISLTGELNGKLVNITDPSFGTTISSLNPGVATVLSSGLVTAVANGGTNIWITNGSFGANIPVTVQITQSSRTVGQEGGTLEFHNGLVLEVPPGAVPGPTPILIKDLPLDQVNAIVMNPALKSSSVKRFLGGFTAEPDGLVFNGPVMATIPVLPLNPREIPVQVEILLNEQRYRYVTSQFEYLRNQGVVKVNIQHFSSVGFIGVGPDPETVAQCTTCPLPDPLPDDCKDPLNLEPPCCNIPPNVRLTCGYTPENCYCCKETDPIYVQEIGVDFSNNLCQLLGSTLKVQYNAPGCGGAWELHDIGETDCKNIDMNVTIEPSQSTLAVGDHVDLKAYVKGIWNEGEFKGKVAFSHAPIPAIWSSDDPLIARFPIPIEGRIYAIKSYPDPIAVWAKVSESIPNVTYEPALIKVTGDYIEIRATKTDLCPGEEVIFEAFLMNSANEELGRILVEWSSDRPSTATCNPSQGFTTTITAGNVEDEAQITAYSADPDHLAIFPVVVSRKAAIMNITSYHNGDRAYAAGANLVGTIEECGTRRVKWLKVTNGSNTNWAQIGDDSKFGTPAPFNIILTWGINHLTFSTYDANNGRVPNNMEGIDFTLNHVPHCLKSGNTRQLLPPILYGTPVTWYSEKPLIASVDSNGFVTGHANGWAKLFTYWAGNTVVRWVGVSTETNYLYTHQDDPFYEPEHVPNPAVVQMLGQMGYYTIASDAKNKYFVGGRSEVILPECVGWDRHMYPSMGSLYDGTSIQDFFTYMDVIPWDDLFPSYCNTHVYPYAVNEKGQAVGYIEFNDWNNWLVGRTGFMYSNGVLSFIDHPFGYFTELWDINNLGKAVGWVDYGTGGGRVFIYDVVYRTFTDIGPVGEGGPQNFKAVYINDSGQVLGHELFWNSTLIWIYRDGVYEAVAGPSPYFDILYGIRLHESGQVYVTYENGQSVLLTRCAP
jgi:hypothetical protein